MDRERGRGGWVVDEVGGGEEEGEGREKGGGGV